VKRTFILGARVRAATAEPGDGQLARLTSYEGNGFYGIETLGEEQKWLIAHEVDLALDYPSSATDRVDADDRAYHADRLRQFHANLQSGTWPADACAQCRPVGVVPSAGCCQSFAHHVGSFCLHCGNDERHGQWTYRGKK
jgi:hypothetical protein